MRRPARAAAWVLLAVVLGGCVALNTTPDAAHGQGGAVDADAPGAPRAPDAPGSGGAPPQRLAYPCDACWEPTVAVDGGGRVYVVEGKAERIAAWAPGNATPRYLAAPPLPDAAAGATTGDETVAVDPAGRLFFYELVRIDAGTAARPAGGGGVHVARSDDHGETWAVNRYINVAERPDDPVAVVDRPWLGFGADGALYLAVHGLNGAEWISRSDDGGASFGPWRPFAVWGAKSHVNPPGPPTVTTGGHVVIPYVENPAPAPAAGGDAAMTALAVAVSTDGGATFTEHTVRDYGPAGGATLPPGGFPVADAGAGDRVYAAWRTSGGEVQAALSRDGGATWSPPVAVANGSGRAVSHPWVRAHGDGTASLAWYRDAGDNRSDQALQHATVREDGDELALASGPRTVAASVPPNPTHGGGYRSTDFPHFALGPVGDPWLVWTTGRENVVQRLPGPTAGGAG